MEGKIFQPIFYVLYKKETLVNKAAKIKYIYIYIYIYNKFEKYLKAVTLSEKQ